MAGKLLDLRGIKVNRVTFLWPTADPAIWTARCDCGKEFNVRHSNVRHRGQKSCGCAKVREHGMSRHPAYKAWAAMHSRCSNPKNRDFPSTGGRGITVCERWYTFAAFWEDTGTGWSKGMTLQRINKDRDFRPSNVLWSTRDDILSARRGAENIPTPGGRMTSVAGLSALYNIPVSTIRSRIQRGWKKADLHKPPSAVHSSRGRSK